MERRRSEDTRGIPAGVVEEIEDERMRQIIKEHEEEMARIRQQIQELEQEERRLKDMKEKEGRIDFFPTWKPVQGVKNNAEEEEQDMTIGEDGRPYISVRRKTEEEKEKVHDGKQRFWPWQS